MSQSAEGREGNRKFQGCFDPMWLSGELGKMKGRMWGSGLAQSPPCRLCLLFTC